MELNCQNTLKILRQHKEFLQKKYQLTRLGLFGSVARNTMQQDSDIDVVIEMLQPNLFVIANLKEELEILLQHPVDLVRYRAQMNPALKQRIEQETIDV